ncbi:hypothetical protein [Vibrio sp. SCSIO 43137]|uniref:hypothetical protein n=1 Tax=Vibrio sp. SCSIO 43137 TaxID=3021011 RepID=UPI002308115E|nr:hypothetical protein [Vibrio sp. SCSIO 43137]WCE32095.1 hypothetical protein PK654_16445 [Vibrio sp. SCSIO 43137]
MLKRNVLLVAFTSITCSKAVIAANESLESCSRFLPAGTTYEITITTRVDKTGESPAFDGNLNIDWSEEELDSLKFDISEFVKCTAPLITSEPEFNE